VFFHSKEEKLKMLKKENGLSNCGCYGNSQLNFSKVTKFGGVSL